MRVIVFAYCFFVSLLTCPLAVIVPVTPQEAASLQARLLQMDKKDPEYDGIRRRIHSLSEKATFLEDLAATAKVRVDTAAAVWSAVFLGTAVVLCSCCACMYPPSCVPSLKGKYDGKKRAMPVAPPRSDIVSFISSVPAKRAVRAAKEGADVLWTQYRSGFSGGSPPPPHVHCFAVCVMCLCVHRG